MRILPPSPDLYEHLQVNGSFQRADLKVNQFQEISQDRLGYNEVTNPQSPSTADLNYLACYLSKCWQWGCTWGGECYTSPRESHQLRFHIIITVSTNDFPRVSETQQERAVVLHTSFYKLA